MVYIIEDILCVWTPGSGIRTNVLPDPERFARRLIISSDIIPDIHCGTVVSWRGLTEALNMGKRKRRGILAVLFASLLVVAVLLPAASLSQLSVSIISNPSSAKLFTAN